jgi:small subunit ribosomal protein S7
MYDGKKSTAQAQVYKAFEIVEKELKEDALSSFHQAVANIRPTMEVRPRRVGGASYQVPTPVRGPRQDSLGIRWMIEAARARSNSQFHTFGEKLAAEIIDAVNGEGGAVKKKEDMERVAEANRAFAHFRW